jgi:hypothetical protein
MRKASLILANAVLGLALVAPIVSADEAELRKDTRQMHEAWRAGDMKGVENERREIEKDRAEIARDRGERDGRGDRNWRRHRRHHRHPHRHHHNDG